MKRQTNHLKIPTAQNVNIYHEPANVGDRILAAIIDYLIIFGILIAILLLSNIMEQISDSPIMNFFISLLFIIPYFFYHLILEIILHGQTIGKKQMNIRIIRLDGSPPRISNYIMRWIMRPVDIFFFGIVAILTISINNKGQRLGDIAAGTSVIKDKANLDLNEILVYEFLDDKRYQPKYRQAQMLPADELNVVKGLIRQKSSAQNTKDLEKLAAQYRHLLGIESKEPPYIFLKTLVKDFIYLSSEASQPATKN